MLVQPIERRGFGAGIDIAIQLGTIAGRKDDGLTHSRLGEQIGQSTASGVCREGRALAQRDWCAAVIESESDQSHARKDSVPCLCMPGITGRGTRDCVELRGTRGFPVVNETQRRSV